MKSILPLAIIVVLLVGCSPSPEDIPGVYVFNADPTPDSQRAVSATLSLSGTGAASLKGVITTASGNEGGSTCAGTWILNGSKVVFKSDQPVPDMIFSVKSNGDLVVLDGGARYVKQR